MYQERWIVEKRGDDSYHFTVKKASPPIGPIIWGVLAIPVFGVGLIVLACHILPRLSPSQFSVSEAGFEVKGRKIPMARVNSWGVRNASDNTLHNTVSLTGQMNLSMASKAYRLTVQAAGSRVDLATALTLEQAEGLMADVERALNGTL